MVCPKCISHNSEGAEICHWCGNALRQEQGTTLAETVVACVACGSQLKTSANFCSQCGAARIPFHEPVDTEPELACAACGGSINPGANYCKWCGLAVANSLSSTGSASPVLGKVVAPRDKDDQRGLTREQQRSAAAQQTYLIQEQSAAHKDQRRAQREDEKKRAREAAEWAARIAKERRFQVTSPKAWVRAFRVARDRHSQNEKERAIRETARREERYLKEAARQEERALKEAARREERALKEAERRERERIEREAQARERVITRPAKEEDDFDVVAIAKTIVQFAPMVTGGKALSPAEALLVKQVLEEFQKKSDDTSASAALSYFNQAAVSWKVVTGNATNRDMAIFAVYQFLSIYKAWKSLR